jgi:SAM-dependent methyltransferase
MKKQWDEIYGYFTPNDRRAIQLLSTDKVVLEIGCLYGRSTLCIAEVAERVISVDTFKAHDNGVIQMEEFTNLEGFKENIKGYDNIDWVVGRSEEVIPDIDMIFDVVFIDGLHYYDQVLVDVEVCWSKLKMGGAMAFHDFNTYHDDVGRAVKQLSLVIYGPHFGSDVAYIQKPDREFPYG